MVRIMDGRGTGKTFRLMLLAKETKGILVCENPRAMEVKAQRYGLSGFECISYRDLIDHEYDEAKPVYIDEIDLFFRDVFGGKVAGYSLSEE